MQEVMAFNNGFNGPPTYGVENRSPSFPNVATVRSSALRRVTGPLANNSRGLSTFVRHQNGNARVAIVPQQGPRVQAHVVGRGGQRLLADVAGYVQVRNDMPTQRPAMHLQRYSNGPVAKMQDYSTRIQNMQQTQVFNPVPVNRFPAKAAYANTPGQYSNGQGNGYVGQYTGFEQQVGAYAVEDEVWYNDEDYAYGTSDLAYDDQWGPSMEELAAVNFSEKSVESGGYSGLSTMVVAVEPIAVFPKTTGVQRKAKFDGPRKTTKTSIIPSVELCSTIEKAKKWVCFRGKLEMRFDAIVQLKTPIDYSQLAKRFVISDNSGTLQVVYYDMDVEMPTVEVNEWLKVVFVIRNSGVNQIIACSTATPYLLLRLEKRVEESQEKLQKILDENKIHYKEL